jgi:hypothetical protein
LTNLNATHGQLAIGQDADADDLTGDSAVGRLTLGAGEDLNLYHGGTNSYIVNDTGDLIIDTAGDIQLDAAGNDFKFLAGGTEILNITNSSSDVVIKPVVDAKDIIFQQRDGTAVMTVEDDVSLAINNDITVAGRAVGSQDADQATGSDGGTITMNLADHNNFEVSVGHTVTLTFSNQAVGQTGCIFLDKTSASAVSFNTIIAINASSQAALSTAGVYLLTYMVKAASGTGSILVSVSGALTADG